MGKQKTYSWEFKLHMVHLLEKGSHNVSQISRDYHVTRSLLYAWIRLYQERGEAAFVPSRASRCPPEVERPHNEQEQVAYLERLCGQQALELERLALGGRCVKKSLASAPIRTVTCPD
jgi:transposase